MELFRIGELTHAKCCSKHRRPKGYNKFMTQFQDDLYLDWQDLLQFRCLNRAHSVFLSPIAEHLVEAKMNNAQPMLGIRDPR